MACNSDRYADHMEQDNISSFVLPNCLGEGTFVKYKGLWMSKLICKYETFLKDLEEFQFRNDDILVAAFPKSGTTWVQEIISQIECLYREDGKTWKSINMDKRFQMLEPFNSGIKFVEEIKSPRLLKTHLSYDALPASIETCGCKIIYIARNPGDVCVSQYHFMRMLIFFSYTGPFEEFFEYFIRGEISCGPWADHVMSFWKKRREENLLFLTYERIHKEPHKVISEISNFIGRSITNDQLNKIVDATKFDNMKNNPSANYSWLEDNGRIIKTEGPFCRKGIVGDFKNYMDDSMLEKFEKLFRVDPALKELFN